MAEVQSSSIQTTMSFGSIRTCTAADQAAGAEALVVIPRSATTIKGLAKLQTSFKLYKITFLPKTSPGQVLGRADAAVWLDVWPQSSKILHQARKVLSRCKDEDSLTRKLQTISTAAGRGVCPGFKALCIPVAEFQGHYL